MADCLHTNHLRLIQLHERNTHTHTHTQLDMTCMSSQTAVWNTLMAPGMVVLIKKMAKEKDFFFCPMRNTHSTYHTHS